MFWELVVCDRGKVCVNIPPVSPLLSLALTIGLQGAQNLGFLCVSYHRKENDAVTLQMLWEPACPECPPGSAPLHCLQWFLPGSLEAHV